MKPTNAGSPSCPPGAAVRTGPALRHGFLLAFAMLLAGPAGSAWAGLVLSGGGLTLVEEGGTFAAGNLAPAGTAFAKDEIGVAPHAIAQANDGFYGNAKSWIAGGPDSFIGISLGATPVTLNRLAFGRDNLGLVLDRALGTYTLQVTTVPNPDATTPDGNWTTLGTLDYQSAGGANFATPILRHLYSFTPVEATGIRLRTVTSSDYIGIDELEVYAFPPPVRVETGGVLAPNNLAFGKTAFAKDEVGVAPHAIAKVNDGVFGNANSWIAGTADSFVGINLGASPVTLSRVAFGRDNEGVQATRVDGTYTLQFTTTPNPAAATPDASWITLGSIVYPGTITSPALRHRFSFAPVQATGFRIKVQTDSFPIAIDELELYDYDPVPQIAVEQPAGTALAPTSANVLFGSENLNTPGSPKTFTLRNTGTLGLAITNAATVGGDAGDFIVDTAGMAATVPFGGSTTFTAAFSPGAPGNRTTTLRVTSNDPGTPAFDVQLSGTGIDILPAVIAAHADVTAVGTSLAGSAVTYGPATATDDSGADPVITYSHASGSTFPLGTTTVTITATDAAGNAATATFTVTVTLAPPALVENGGAFAATNLAAGKTAFAKDEVGAGPHAIAKVNDGIYGNDSSWIAGTTDSFVGINLGSTPITFSRVAFGRDNEGVQATRVDGTYTLQFTTTPNPDATTPDADWITLGSIDYPGSLTSPALRHRYSFTPVQATGFRIRVLTSAFPIAIDELELYDYDPVLQIAVEQPTGTALVPTSANVLFGRENLGTPGSAKTFTVRSTGTGAPSIASVTTIGGDAADFVVNTAGMAATVPFGGSTTFTVAFSPGALGNRTTTLRVSSNDPGTPDFDVQLSGTGVLAPVIAAHSNVTAVGTIAEGAVVTYEPATATDDSGADPVITYSHASGSAFPFGTTTVTITATDADGNAATATFTVTVILPPPTLVETGGTFAATNLAAGKTAFAKDEVGAAPHAIAKVNDGIYGNDSSWIAGTTNSFVGINLGGTPITISRVAFGRDNEGVQATRVDGTYTLQFTTTPNPDATTPDAAWITLGSFVYPGSLTSPALRHRYSFTPVQATGFRIRMLTSAFPIAIDELELYDYDPVPQIAVEQPAGTALAPTSANVLFGNENLNTPGSPKTFTVHSTGTGALSIASVTTIGGDATDFVVNTAGMAATVPFGGSTTFTVAFSPGALGNRTTTLRMSSNDPGTPAFDVQLSGTGIDILPPVIAAHADVTAVGTIAEGAVATYGPATATDNSGAAPVITYSHASGSAFPLGTTTVTITATDAAGNASTATFTVTVILPPPTLAETGGTFAATNLAAGKTAFAKDEVGAAPHAIAKVNDGIYGNDNSWIAGTTDSFVGINLGSTPITISGVAFGRDNEGAQATRVEGTYTLQFTTTPNPDATTPDADWINFGSIDYPGSLTSPALRHRYSFTPVQATGFRIRVLTSAFPIAIDELELYDYDPVPQIAVEQPAGTALVPTTANVLFGNENLGTTGSARTFTLRNTGTAALSIGSAATVGGAAANFTVDTAGMATAVPFGGSTTFTVAFSPDALGNRTTTLRVTSNDPGTPAFDVQLSGTGIDILPPVIATPANITVFSTGPLTSVTYAPTATDNSGSTPSMTVVPPGGSPFILGVTTVNVTATDGSGNESFASFTVTVIEPPHLEVQQPAGTVLAGSSPIVDFGTRTLGESAAKVFTLKNTGLTPLAIGEAITVGGHAGDFTVAAAGMDSTVAPGATTALTVTFAPSTPGARASTLRISSNDPDRPDYDITVSGTGVDTSPPEIRLHLDRTAVATSAAGTVVRYGPARITDNSGTAPTVTYSPVSGSVFPPGVTTVVITATDATGNIATSSFTVTVDLPPQLVVESPVGTTLLNTGVPVAWGEGKYGQTTVPNGLTGITAVASSGDHTLALRSDGTVTGWGPDGYGEVSGSAGLTGIVAISAGASHSVALRNDGTVVAWGSNDQNQLNGANTPANVVAIAAGSDHSLALMDDGTVFAWGANDAGQLDVPSDLDGVVAIAAGERLSLALKSDGTVVEWGEVFSAAPTGLSGVSSLAAGHRHTLALKADGTVVGWGSDGSGEISGLATANGIRAVSAGLEYSLALKNDGTLLAVGDDGSGQVSGAAPWRNVVAISAGRAHAVAVVRVVPVVDFGTRSVGSSTTRTITLRNPGLGRLNLVGISAAGGNAAEFTVDTAGLPASLPANGSATITVTFTPTTTAPSTTTLRVASNAARTPAFDITLKGNTADNVAPVLAAHADVSAVPTSTAGAVVTYAPATATDDSGAPPVITYSHASGSVFPRGATTVTVTATDANGNTSTGTFTVIVAAPLALIETGGTFAPDNLATGGTAFAKDLINAAPHAIANVNDGLYGNANSWIAGSKDSFIGISLGASPVSINQVAFGRDNEGNHATRAEGSYTLQFTTVPDPDAATPDSSWSTLAGTIENPGTLPDPSLRHRFLFPTVEATGIRIKTRTTGIEIGIDEIELYSVPSAVAPVAGADTLLRLDSTRTAKVLQSVLLANDTDAEGDSLFVTAVGDVLPAGATVQLAGNFVVYTAPAANSGNGSFTYTVDDGAGHTATGTVTVTQVSAPTAGSSPPGAISANVSGADIVVTFIGVPGRGYRVQYTTSLGSPYTWEEFSPAAVITAPAGGVFSHTDPAPGGGARFYRAIPNP